MRKLNFALKKLIIRKFSNNKYLSDKLKEVLEKQIQDIKDAGTYKKERVITSSQNSEISVKNSKSHVLNFCANNYLGLSDNPELIKAAKDTLDSHGLGKLKFILRNVKCKVIFYISEGLYVVLKIFIRSLKKNYQFFILQMILYYSIIIFKKALHALMQMVL
jgi:hypothetical protein